MDSLKVLLVGSGAREHAIAESLVHSRGNIELYGFFSNVNPGIKRMCREYKLGDINEPKKVSEYASSMHIELAFIGPEEPNFHGVPDELDAKGVRVIGAKKDVAMLEMSKAKMRRLMWNYAIPGRLPFRTFYNWADATSYLKDYAESAVIKPARQAGGRGVRIMPDLREHMRDTKKDFAMHAAEDVEKYMSEYDDIEDKILVEEKVAGAEFTVQAFVDGKTLQPLGMIQDNKHAYVDDLGPETGGMGTVSDRGLTLPFIPPTEYEKTVDIIRLSVEAVQRETGEKYHGIIAGQMMLTSYGPTIIEFYSRLGDPEAINALNALDIERGPDLLDICEAILDERLSVLSLKFKDKASVVKCIAPEGYPDRREIARGHPVSVDEKAINKAGCKVYYASVDVVDGNMLTGGARLAEIYSEADEIPDAAEKIEKAVPYIRMLDGWRTFHRSDIGTRELLARRQKLANLQMQTYQYREKMGMVEYDLDWIPGKGKVEVRF